MMMPSVVSADRSDVPPERAQGRRDGRATGVVGPRRSPGGRRAARAVVRPVDGRRPRSRPVAVRAAESAASRPARRRRSGRRGCGSIAVGVARRPIGSWVTRMMVMPSSALSWLEQRRGSPRRCCESRLPVGSSAIRSGAAVDQRPGDGDALLLAAGELRRLVVEPVAQADPLEQRRGPVAALARSERPRAGVGQRHHHVLQAPSAGAAG